METSPKLEKGGKNVWWLDK